MAGADWKLESMTSSFGKGAPLPPISKTTRGSKTRTSQPIAVPEVKTDQVNPIIPTVKKCTVNPIPAVPPHPELPEPSEPPALPDPVPLVLPDPVPREPFQVKCLETGCTDKPECKTVIEYQRGKMLSKWICCYFLMFFPVSLVVIIPLFVIIPCCDKKSYFNIVHKCQHCGHTIATKYPVSPRIFLDKPT